MSARWRIAVVAKRSYCVTESGLDDAAMQQPLVDAPTFAADGLQLEHDTDLLWKKPMVDVVVLGHVYPHENRHRCTMSIRVGALARTLAVSGDRRLERDRHGNPRFSPPQPFERISLGWESAYGGYDASALEAYGDPSEALRRETGVDERPQFGFYAYPRNPVGRGYLVEISDAAIARCQLPNLEQPGHILTPERLIAGNSLAWPGGPLPASTAWLPYSYFPRMSLLGLSPLPFDEDTFPIRELAEVKLGLLSEQALALDAPAHTRYDLRAAQSSAPGMRVERIEPGDAVEIRNAHPTQAIWRFSLTVRPPQMWFALHNEAPQQLIPRIRTVIIEPDHESVRLVWVGELALERSLSTEQLDTIQHAVAWG
ncbi:DUF2169 domain-containing protein [Enhygromyxa salina]|uniref:DUF2169 domain-containing protein n=1 Tax=Enhygromyxa salina TaxID=215803 RepID=A0A2S9YXC0_9BACT|nr:DUF2169 domain-containing protein [Enhygromyxa salina]PRQ09745.1 hypothetical protein ENSA7_05000 [Enhygromyxa salina]